MKQMEMTAGQVLDLAFDLGLERPKIATTGEWDGGRIHILSYGPLAYRKTMEISAPAKKEDVERLMRTALVSTAAAKLPAFVAPAESPIGITPDGLVAVAKRKAKRSSKAAH